MKTAEQVTYFLVEQVVLVLLLRLLLLHIIQMAELLMLLRGRFLSHLVDQLVHLVLLVVLGELQGRLCHLVVRSCRLRT